MRRLLPIVLAAAVCLACKTSPDEPGHSAPSSAPSKNDRLRLVDAPAEGDVDAVVRGALSGAQKDGRRVVVYAGATWCDPCERFHEAARRGELDATFPDVDFVVFDFDRDKDRLASAGYAPRSKLIPLFALPGPDGRSSGQHVEGGTKGDGAVAGLVARLKALLAR